MRLRVGLIGLGDGWQNRHAPALRSLADRFEVRAICEQVAHRAEQIAADFDAAAVDGYRTLCCREDIDAVMILAPQWYGALPILAACESGKAVYCAAGLDLEPEEAQAVKRRVEESGIAFMAEFPRRYASATLRLKELIATRLGRPRILFCHQRSPAPTQSNHVAHREPHHAALRDLVELVDWCSYVVDSPPTAVTGPGASQPDRRPGGRRLSHDEPRLLRSGGPGHGCGGADQLRALHPGRLAGSDLVPPAGGPAGLLCRRHRLHRPAATVVWFDDAGRHQESLDSERPVGEQMLTQFHRAVTSLVRKTSDLEDAYRALTVVQQARRSHAEGRRILLGP